MPFESDVDEKLARSSRTFPKDRKLGDEWLDWDGSTDGEIEEPKGKFIFLSSLVMLGFAALMVVAWYLMVPRTMQWPEEVRLTVTILYWGALVFGFLLYILIMLEVLTEHFSVIPYGWSERMLLWLLPKAIWMGRRLGLSRDQVGNAFVKVNNALTRSYRKRINRNKLLVLLPRCLNKDTRQQIRELMEGKPYSVHTVGGGEEARKVIKKERPSFIIALACERDLISGIRDVALHIPVIGIPNKRPEGPCKNTYIDIDDFRNALRFFQQPDESMGPGPLSRDDAEGMNQ
jgi:hypothetical protein